MHLIRIREFSATLKLGVRICRENLEQKSDGDESESKIIFTLLTIVARDE